MQKTHGVNGNSHYDFGRRCPSPPLRNPSGPSHRFLSSLFEYEPPHIIGKKIARVMFSSRLALAKLQRSEQGPGIAPLKKRLTLLSAAFHTAQSCSAPCKAEQLSNLFRSPLREHP